MDKKKALAAAISAAAVVGVFGAVATYKSPTDRILDRLERGSTSSSYCDVLAEQHRQHRNASGAMARELDAQTAGHDFDYEAKTVALSDAMYESLKRDNGCP